MKMQVRLESEDGSSTIQEIEAGNYSSALKHAFRYYADDDTVAVEVLTRMTSFQKGIEGIRQAEKDFRS